MYTVTSDDRKNCFTQHGLSIATGSWKSSRASKRQTSLEKASWKSKRSSTKQIVLEKRKRVFGKAPVSQI
jgi:hypothetical protein